MHTTSATLTTLNRTGQLMLVAIVALVLAGSWLVFPYFVQGRQVLTDVSSEVKTEKRLRAESLAQYLTQRIDLPNGTEITALNAVPEYFEHSDRAGLVSQYRPDQNFVFFVAETTHDFQLPDEVPTASLEVDGKFYQPVSSEGPEVVEHHRTSIYRFAKADEQGAPLVGDDTQTVKLHLYHHWDEYVPTSLNPTQVHHLTYEWETNQDIPEALLANTLSSPILLFTLSAGLLSATLTPCLLQLLVIYLASMAGVTAENLTQGTVDREAKRRVFQMGLYFVLGFILLFTVAGAIIGASGQQAQILFAESARTISILAGITVILLGFWLAIRTNQPVLCKLPMANFLQRIDPNHRWRSMLTAMAFSLGCLSCFGGAIIGVLFVYVGSLGSASVGASVMFLFSAGVSIPFLLAALFLSRMTKVMNVLQRTAKPIGFVSSAIIVAFGIVLITDNFHVLSNIIYPWLRLS